MEPQATTTPIPPTAFVTTHQTFHIVHYFRIYMKTRKNQPTIEYKMEHFAQIKRETCRLSCNLERKEIANSNKRLSLNRKNEGTGKCRYYYSNYLKQ